jgi:hypothetical protein
LTQYGPGARGGAPFFWEDIYLDINKLKIKILVLLPKKHHKSTGKAPQKTLPGTSKGTAAAPQKHYLSTIKIRTLPATRLLRSLTITINNRLLQNFRVKQGKIGRTKEKVKK